MGNTRNQRKVYVWVDYSHIKNGKPRKANSCPIALALREKFNISSRDISVNNDQITFLCGQRFPNDIAIPLTKSQGEWVDRYDGGDCPRESLEPIRIAIPLNEVLESLLTIG